MNKIARVLLPAIIVVMTMSDVSNITVRVTAERTARLTERKAICEYERHMKSLQEHYKMKGGGEQSETEDMERAVPRLKGMAEIEQKGLDESPVLRETAAFVDAFSPVLALDAAETSRYVAHLAKKGDDLGKSDKPLFDKTSSAAFQAELAGKLSRSGCGYTGGVFTYSSAKKLEKLRRQMMRRLESDLSATPQ